MTPEQYKRENNYRLAMAVARQLLRNAVINESEYSIIDTKLTEYYRPILIGLNPKQSLIQSGEQR